MAPTETIKKVHQGRNIKRFREIQDIKQETLAYMLGEGWTQKKVSQLEAKEIIEQDILEQVAKILHVTPEAIQKFSDDTALNIISNTFTSHDTSTFKVENAINIQPTFNPLDKLLDVIEENKKLYERLVQAEKDKVEFMERLLKSTGKTD